MKKIRMCIVIIVFMIIILFPATIMVFGINFNVELNGTTVSVTKPILGIKGIMNGDNQTEINSYLQEIIPIRNGVIKTGNQIIYSVFNKSTNDNIVIGSNGQLFEKAYITKELQYSEMASDEALEEEIVHLEELREKLNARGINVLLFLTPYKTEFYKDDIPWFYKLCSGNIDDSVNDYERFKTLLLNSDIEYFDSVEYVCELQQEYEEELFPKTGTHWTQLTGTRVTKKLISELEEKFGYDLSDVEVTYEKTDEPVWPDADIFETLNIYSKPYDNYYIPSINVVSEGNEKPDMLARGCSFMGQSVYYLIEKGIVNESVYMENTFARINNSEVIGVSDYASLDLKEMLKGKDLIIFEANQASIGGVGLGLMEYMYQNFDEIFE